MSEQSNVRYTLRLSFRFFRRSEFRAKQHIYLRPNHAGQEQKQQNATIGLSPANETMVGPAIPEYCSDH